jgi:hypothetical protein
MAGEHLDLTNAPASQPAHPAHPAKTAGESNADKPYLGVTFECCQVYRRIYINQSGDEYVGRCPRCGQRVQFRVGSGGTNQRFFTAR